jgi:hypothetical protein
MIFVLVHPAWFGGWCWRKVTLTNPAAAGVGRVFIRCQQFLPGKHPAFDSHLATARQTLGWRAREIKTPHLPYVAHPAEPAVLLLDLAAGSR